MKRVIECLTLPMMTSQTSCPWTWARARTSLMATAPSWAAPTLEKHPLKEPERVRRWMRKRDLSLFPEVTRVFVILSYLHKKSWRNDINSTRLKGRSVGWEKWRFLRNFGGDLKLKWKERMFSGTHRWAYGPQTRCKHWVGTAPMTWWESGDSDDPGQWGWNILKIYLKGSTVTLSDSIWITIKIKLYPIKIQIEVLLQLERKLFQLEYFFFFFFPGIFRTWIYQLEKDTGIF